MGCSFEVWDRGSVSEDLTLLGAPLRGIAAELTYASGAQHPVSVTSATFMQPAFAEDGLDIFFNARNDADTQRQALDFDIFIPRELADGSYAVGEPMRPFA
jgi:hypothetical protein